MIKIKLFQREISGLDESIERISNVRGFSVTEDGVPVHIEMSGDGLTVSGCGEYKITYSKKNELFRGIALLAGSLEQGKTEINISEKSRFDTCGVVFDCSRNAVPKPEKIADMLARMALMGFNAVMLYTEDTFEVEGYEYFGYLRGRYSCDELREFDRIALGFGIELIPCIQTLAHLKTALRWEYAADMKDSDDILLIGEEKTYEFIDAMIRSVRNCFSAKRIHIGMDEAFEVGKGNYIEKNGYHDRFEILSEHLDRVCRITDKYNFEPIMWSDMFYRIGSETGNYYDPDANIPDWLPEKIPANISMCYWDYYSRDGRIYDAMLEGHKALKRKTIFAGGIWTWTGMSADYQYTFETSTPALISCEKAGIKEVFATIWGDDGSEISHYTALPGMQFYAEYNFAGTTDIEVLSERFKMCTGYDIDEFMTMGLDEPDPGVFDREQNVLGDGLKLSRQVLYQDVLCGLFDKNYEHLDLERFYAQKEEKINAVLAPPKDLEYLFDYYKALAKVLAKKCKIGAKIREAYKAGDKTKMAEYAEVLAELLCDTEVLCEKAYVMWHIENKPFGFDVFDMRLGGVLARIKTARARILEWCRGETERLEELEEELLYYDSEKTKGKIPTIHAYHGIATPNLIVAG